MALGLLSLSPSTIEQLAKVRLDEVLIYNNNDGSVLLTSTNHAKNKGQGQNASPARPLAVLGAVARGGEWLVPVACRVRCLLQRRGHARRMECARRPAGCGGGDGRAAGRRPVAPRPPQSEWRLCSPGAQDRDGVGTDGAAAGDSNGCCEGCQSACRGGTAGCVYAWV